MSIRMYEFLTYLRIVGPGARCPDRAVVPYPGQGEPPFPAYALHLCKPQQARLGIELQVLLQRAIHERVGLDAQGCRCLLFQVVPLKSRRRTGPETQRVGVKHGVILGDTMRQQGPVAVRQTKTQKVKPRADHLPAADSLQPASLFAD